MRKTILDLEEFHKRVAAGRKPRSAVRLLAPGTEPIVTAESRVVRFVLSDGSVDRYGDTIDARGWVIKNYLANPVVLFGHDAESVENVIGRMVKVWVDGDTLLGDVEFMEASVNPTAETVFQMVKGRYLNTGSVGFQPIEYGLSKDKSRPGGIDFKKQELLEFSIVPIPANPNALVQARSAGIDVDRLGLVAHAAPVSKKGLYHVSELARILSSLGWLEDDVAWEADYEGDGSAVPQMLADALKQLGAALVAMTIEEVAELLADDEDDVPLILIDGEVALAALTPAQRAVIRLANAASAAKPAPVVTLDLTAVKRMVDDALAEAGVTRAGKVLSAANHKSLSEAHDAIVEGCAKMKSVIDAATDSDPNVVEADAADLVAAAEAEARARRARRARALAHKHTTPKVAAAAA